MNELEIEKNEKRNEKFIQEFKAWLKNKICQPKQLTNIKITWNCI